MTDPASPEGLSASPDSGNFNSPLDLLLDVQLEATIRFGERQLLLRDILSARPGSVIELDRDLNQPADLLVAGRLIARGEVVVVDGNFGLRVTELANPGQRNQLIPA
jgi:flagellar motor switch protein FliN